MPNADGKTTRAEHAREHIVGPPPPGGTNRRPNPPPAIDLQPGRPAVYQDGFPEVVRRLCLLGMTDEEVAAFFGVTANAMDVWDDAHPEFFAARAGARDLADADMAVRLYQRGMGYSHPDTHIAVSGGTVHQTPIVRHYPPDTDAAKWWLKNRQPGRWRDKTEVEASGSIGLGVIAVPSKAPLIDG